MVLKDKFHRSIEGSSKILITTHIYPDADGIGSQISLCLALRDLGKECFCFNEESLLERYHYLDKQNVVQSIDQIGDFKPDLIIVVDTNTKERTGPKMLEYYQSINDDNNHDCNFLFIDHHPSKNQEDANSCIDTTAAATGQMVGEFIEDLGMKFTPEIALPLYTAMIIDTSSFRYPTVSDRTHRLVSQLLKTGIDPTTAYNGIYGTKNIKHLHLLGKVLGSAKANSTEDIYWIVFNKDDLAQYDADVEDTHAFINHLLILDNIKVACMIRDDGDVIKVSLRSTGEYDVGTIAKELGGGGHSHSAATIIEKTKSLEDIVEQTISKIESTLKSL